MGCAHNKALKRDSCRVAFLVCGDFCGESGLQKLGLGGTHPLTQRYVFRGYIVEILGLFDERTTFGDV
ncbi:DUF3265 domain-containing protein [Vibrio vulnificus]|nr:DUF3265 domain-containing protein [Vibrio vulnificus]